MSEERSIIVTKYVLEITQYPDGREFQKIYPIGKAKRAFSSKNKGKEVEAQPRQSKMY